jgi:predicted MPP superfamily phosphohydrolase
MARIIFAVIIMFSLYAGTNYYIAMKIYQWLGSFITHINIKVYAGIYILFVLSMFSAFLPISSGVKRIISYAGSHWMGIYIYLLMFFVAADLVILLGCSVKMIPSPMFQSIRFYAGLIVILLSVGMVVYGRYNANQIKFVSYDIQTKKSLPADIKIVLISDLHLGAVNSEKNLSKIVNGINNLKPDIVCIAGDIFNNNIYALHNHSETIALLKSVTAVYGVYACLGNHDGGKTFREMTRFLEQSNIKLLNDEHVTIDDRLVLTGRVDSRPIGGFDGLKRKNFADINVPANTDLPVVVMDHNPSNIGQYGNEIDLILSGHTHRGQMFPANLVTKAIYVTHYGHYQKDANSSHVIVTSGAGFWGMPMRIGSNNEIAMITLLGK